MWIDEAAVRRAYILGGRLVIETYADPHTWLVNVPIETVGKSVALLEAELGDRLEATPTNGRTRRAWFDIGLAGGRGKSELHAYVDNDKLVGINVRAVGSPASAERLVKLLTKRFGKPSADYVWSSTPPITLYVDDGMVEIDVGAVPRTEVGLRLD